MCKCANKLIHVAFFIALPVLLSACGGAPADDSPNTPSSAVINKPEVSSNASSLAVSSATSSSAAATSSPVTISSASSKAVSSGQSNSRVARVSSSASSQETPSGFDFLAPEKTTLRLYRLSQTSITLAWDKSFDNVGISHYKIERDGQLIATAEGSNHILADENLAASTDYRYTITAFDFAGNDSGASSTLSVRTLGNANNGQATSSSSSSRSSVSSSQNSTKSSSLSSTNNSKTSSSLSSAINNQKLLKLTWAHPNQRENGSYLTLDEISGYEIRFKPSASSNYVYMVLAGNRTTSFTTDLIPTNSNIEIAVYDTNGLFSAFTPITAEAP